MTFATRALLVLVLVALVSVACANPGQRIATAVCPLERHAVACPKGQVINVVSAVWGRSDTATCAKVPLGAPAPPAPATQWDTATACQSDALVWAQHRCQGLADCSLATPTDARADSCPGVWKYLAVQHECVNELKFYACEDTTADLRCADGSSVWFNSAYWGRAQGDAALCPHQRAAATHLDFHCQADVSRELLDACRGQQDCAVVADAHSLGEPCAGAYKYLKASYSCVANGDDASIALEYFPSTDSVLLRGRHAKKYNALLTGSVQALTLPAALRGLPAAASAGGARQELPARGAGMVFAAAVDAAAVIKIVPALDVPAAGWTLDAHVLFPLNATTTGYHVLADSGEQQSLVIAASGVMGVLAAGAPQAAAYGVPPAAPTAAGQVFLASTATLPEQLAGWKQLTVVFSTHAIRFHLDGVLLGALPLTGTAAGMATIAAVGNAAGGGAPFAGALSRVQFYLTELSDADVARIHAPAPEAFAYAAPTVTYRVGEYIVANEPRFASAAGRGGVLSFSSLEGLPPGLRLHADTGRLEGAPTAPADALPLTIRAANRNGYADASIVVTILAAAPTQLRYATSTARYTLGQRIAPNLPTVGGGSVSRYTVSPPLPAGLKLDPEWGVLVGTPAAVAAAQSYTVTATNGGGSATCELSLAVYLALAYPATKYHWRVGAPVAAAAPLKSSAVLKVVKNPAFSADKLPAGLQLDTATGILSGTPTAPQEATPLAVQVLDGAAVVAEVSLMIYITELQPTSIAYPTSAFVFAKHDTVAVPAPTVAGGAPTAFGIAPLFAWESIGLEFDAATGAFAGTLLHETSLDTNFTVTAWNEGGSISTVISVVVNNLPPGALFYTQAEVVYHPKVKITPNTPVYPTGGSPTVFKIAPKLPKGLIMDQKTGRIVGAPLAVFPATVFTITASNAGGSVGTYVTMSCVPKGDVPAHFVALAAEPAAALQCGACAAACAAHRQREAAPSADDVAHELFAKSLKQLNPAQRQRVALTVRRATAAEAALEPCLCQDCTTTIVDVLAATGRQLSSASLGALALVGLDALPLNRAQLNFTAAGGVATVTAEVVFYSAPATLTLVVGQHGATEHARMPWAAAVELSAPTIDSHVVWQQLGVWDRLQSLALHDGFRRKGALVLTWASTPLHARHRPALALPSMTGAGASPIVAAGLQLHAKLRLNAASKNFMIGFITHRMGSAEVSVEIGVKPDFTWVARVPLAGVALHAKIPITQGQLVFGDRRGLRPAAVIQPNVHLPVAAAATSPFVTAAPPTLAPEFGMTSEEREGCFLGLHGFVSLPITTDHSENMEILIGVRTHPTQRLWASTRLLGVWKPAFNEPRALVSVLASDFQFEGRGVTLESFTSYGLLGYGDTKSKAYLVGQSHVVADWVAVPPRHYAKTAYYQQFVPAFFPAVAGKFRAALPKFITGLRISDLTSTWSSVPQVLGAGSSNELVLPRGFQFGGTLHKLFGHGKKSNFTLAVVADSEKELVFRLNVSMTPFAVGPFVLYKAKPVAGKQRQAQHGPPLVYTVTLSDVGTMTQPVYTSKLSGALFGFARVWGHAGAPVALTLAGGQLQLYARVPVQGVLAATFSARAAFDPATGQPTGPFRFAARVDAKRLLPAVHQQLRRWLTTLTRRVQAAAAATRALTLSVRSYQVNGCVPRDMCSARCGELDVKDDGSRPWFGAPSVQATAAPTTSRVSALLETESSAAAAATAGMAAAALAAADAALANLDTPRAGQWNGVLAFGALTTRQLAARTAGARNFPAALAAVRRRLAAAWSPAVPSDVAGSGLYVAAQIERGACVMATLDSPACLGACSTDAEVDSKFKALFAAAAELAKMRSELSALTAVLGTAPHAPAALQLGLELVGADLTAELPTAPQSTTVHVVLPGTSHSFTMPLLFNDPLALLDAVSDGVVSELQCHLRTVLKLRVLENAAELCGLSAAGSRGDRPVGCAYPGTTLPITGLYAHASSQELLTDFPLAGEELAPTRPTLGGFWQRPELKGCPTADDVPTSCAAAAQAFLHRYPKLAALTFATDPRDIWAFYKAQSATAAGAQYQWMGMTCERCQPRNGQPAAGANQFLPLLCLPGGPVHTLDATAVPQPPADAAAAATDAAAAAAMAAALTPKAAWVVSGFRAKDVAVTIGPKADGFKRVAGAAPTVPGVELLPQQVATLRPALPLTTQWSLDVFVQLPLRPAVGDFQVLLAGARDTVVAATADGDALGRLDAHGRFHVGVAGVAAKTPGWYRLTVVGTGGHQRWYLDGRKVGECACQATGELLAVGNAPTAAAGNRQWQGATGKLRLFNYALSDRHVEWIGANVENDGGAYDA